MMPNLGLYYSKARFYSPVIGRFMQTDPIWYADDLNLYGYVGNNPLNLADPSGLMTADAFMRAGKLADSTAVQIALGFIAGYDLYQAITNPNATAIDYAIGALGLIPGIGKEAGLGFKGAKTGARLRRLHMVDKLTSIMKLLSAAIQRSSLTRAYLVAADYGPMPWTTPIASFEN